MTGAGVMVHVGCSAQFPAQRERLRTMLSLPSQTLRSFPVPPISELAELVKRWQAGSLPLLLHLVPMSLLRCLQYLPN